MKRIILTTLLACVFVSVAQAACDTKSLKGSYEIAATGLFNGTNCGLIGVANFDGKGTMTTTTLQGCGGQPVNNNGSYSYNVNANCMGNATNTGTGLNVYFVLNKALSVGSIFFSSTGNITFGTLIKQ